VKSSAITLLGEYMIELPYKPRDKDDNDFQECIAGDEARTMASDFGFHLAQEHDINSAIWIWIPFHVKHHKDRYGDCLLYLHSGHGTLVVLKKGKLYDFYMSPGQVVLFSDRLQHWWFSDSPCRMLAVNVKPIETMRNGEVIKKSS
jgi:hypothetical protein